MMNKKIIFSVLVLLLPVLVINAQGSADTSAGNGSAPAVPVRAVSALEVATATPRATVEAPTITVKPVVTHPTPTPVAPEAPTEVTVLDVPATYPISSKVAPIMVGFVLALAGLGLYLLNRTYNTKNKTEDKKNKKDKSECFNIKKLMDDKLEEIIDLRAKLESKLKETGKEMVREALAGTPEEALLAFIEKGEKEYNRLKELFDKCMIEFDNKKRVVVVHRWSGGANDDWRPWLKVELEKLNFEVLLLDMPDSDTPLIEKWVSYLQKTVGVADLNTYFVGHSIGCQAILRYLETVDKSVGGAVFVSGWFNLENLEDLESREIAKPWIETTINLEKVKKVLPKSTLIISDNDPYRAFEENKKKFTELGSKIIVLHNAEHITGSECQEIIDELNKMI